VRRIWAAENAPEYIDFPHAARAFRIETIVTDLDGSNPKSEIHLGLTSLSRERATRARLLEFHRGHWAIENKVHWVRDVTFDEDRSRIRTGAGAQTMAALRNVALNLLRAAGVKNIAAGTRHCARHPESTLALLGLRAAG